MTTMKKQELTLAGVPAVLYGSRSRRVYLYVHGQDGCKEEAERFAQTACPAGWQVLAVDLPQHGQRQGSPEALVPWQVVPELRALYRRMQPVWKQIRVYGVSLGAWFVMEAFPKQGPEKALFVSPVVDMEALILGLLQEAGATEAQLQAAGQLPDARGGTLSWQYLCWVRQHPLQWNCPTQVLWGTADTLTSHAALEHFRQRTGARLTLLEGGEHWFHTPVQLAALESWEAWNL